MREFFAAMVFMALAGTFAPAAPPQDRDDRRDRDEHRNWKHDEARVRPGRVYPHGRYEHVREVYVARRFDYPTRHIFLYDNSDWVVPAYDLDRCRDWQWDHDQVYVYDDDHHPGWYLLFNARHGRYVHVEYFGVH